MSVQIPEAVRSLLVQTQNAEATEHRIYRNVARRVRDAHNRQVLLRISEEELSHSKLWQQYTGAVPRANGLKVFFYAALARLLGFTFALKLMERGEQNAEAVYESIAESIPEARRIADEEDAHENALLELLDEEKLRYVGAMVLGLSDALVELTGALAGLSFAMPNSRLVCLSGLITGLSATLSMASSQYLSARSEGRDDALKSSVYTGGRYLVTVLLLVLPYFVWGGGSLWIPMALMLAAAFVIIVLFNYYIAVARDLPFFKRAAEMFAICLAVSFVSFVIGSLLKTLLGVEI